MTPSFFLIGAAKAGTSAFFELLARQPGVFAPALKEPNYFALGDRPPGFTGPGDAAGINRRSVWQPHAYEALFQDAAPDQVAGEASVIYLSSPRAAAAVAKAAPAARILVILRDPVERAFSAFRHLRRDGREEHESFRDALAAEPARVAAGWEPLWHYKRLGRYADHLDEWLHHFPRRQLLILRYEQFRDDPRAVLMEACQFLGVEATSLQGLTNRRNVSGAARSRYLQRLLVGDNWVKRSLRPLLPDRVRSRMWQSLMRSNIRPEQARMARDLEVELREHFLPQVKRLERLLEWDLGAWSSVRAD